MNVQQKNYFRMPNEIFSLGLSPGEFAVYAYLLHCENWRTHQCWPSYATISKAVGMSRKTVQKHVWALAEKGLIRTENTTIRRKSGPVCNGSLLYTLKPIQQVIREREKKFLDELKLAEARYKWTQQQNAATPKV